MFKDKFDRHVFSEEDVFDIIMRDSTIQLGKVTTTTPISVDPSLELDRPPTFVEYKTFEGTVEEFDRLSQEKWNMPKSYVDFDIAKYVLDRCSNEEELQRAGEELLLFQERDMFMLLRYLKYLVDTMRENNIIWGVGRGSSVSSFVLYLIGVHRINPIYYDLSIDEFLK